MQNTDRDDIHYLLRKKTTPDTIYVELEDGVDRVRQGRYAYNSEDSTIYSYMKPLFKPSEVCDVKELLFRPIQHIGFMVRKDSPYLEILKIQ